MGEEYFIPWTEEPGCSPWGCKESDMTEQLTLSLSFFLNGFLMFNCIHLCDLLINEHQHCL